MRLPDQTLETATQRVSVALLPLGVCLVVATSAKAAMGTLSDAPMFGLSAAAPYMMLAFSMLILHRPSKLSRSLFIALAASGLYGGAMVYTMIWRPDDVVAVIGGVLLLLIPLCIAWGLVAADELIRSENW